MQNQPSRVLVSDTLQLFIIVAVFSYIEGKLVTKGVSEAVLDVHGIGYQLTVSISTFERLPELGSRVKLLTQFIVREDAQTLYGISS